MPTASYPLDTTGLAASNKVSREMHVLTEVNANAYRILVLDFAPLYQDNFVMISKDSLGVETVLRRDIDYTFTLPYASAIRSIGKMIYGAVALSNTVVQGTLYVTYQTLGGEETADVQKVRELLYEIAYNPRTTSWDVITNKPYQFPPQPHTQPLESLKGTEELIDSIEEVAQAIIDTSKESTPYLKHILNEENPHDTDKEQVGLGLVENYPVATAKEVSDRTSVDKYVLLSQALSIFADKRIPTATTAEVAAASPVSKYVYLRHVLTLLENAGATDTDVADKKSIKKFLYLDQALRLFEQYLPPTPTNQEVVDLSKVEKYLTLKQAVEMFERYKPETASQQEVEEKAPAEKYVYLKHVLELLEEFTPKNQAPQPLLTAKSLYLMRG